MREQTSQACDACRLRKAKCRTDGGLDGEKPRDASSVARTGADHSRVAGNDCDRCSKLGITCTYDLPVHRRGPKGPRKRKLDHDTEGVLNVKESESGDSLTPDVAVPLGEPHAAASNRYDHDSMPDPLSATHYSPTWVRSHPTPGSDTISSVRGIPGPRSGTHPGLEIGRQSGSGPHFHDTPDWNDSQTRPSTDNVCDRTMLRRILDDYVTYIYPAIPIFHLPTFRSSVDVHRDRHDQDFFGMLMGLAALTVGILPRKFKEYQTTANPIRFLGRAEMIDCCYAQTIQSRTPQYFDEVSHTKWTISHVFYLAYFHVGRFNLSRMIEAECNLFARLLELHRTSALTGLNCIETQLRKKAFWLMFYAYVHLQYSNLRKERMAFMDCSILHELDLENLLPVPHDDEYITETSYGTPDSSKPSLAQGFNWRSRLFWCGVKSISRDWQKRRDATHCHCTRRRDLSLYLDFLHSRSRELNYMLDDAPVYLRQWSSRASLDRKHGHFEKDISELQMEVIRTDIHVTHLWLQSIIMDHIESYRPAQTSPAPSASALTPTTPDTAAALLKAKVEWTQREDLCRQLLQVLYMAPDLSLEALGVVLVHKVRDVAVSLLACPYDDTSASSGPATRAKAYLADFSRKLNELDMTEGLSSHILQSWVDLGRTTNGEYDHW